VTYNHLYLNITYEQWQQVVQLADWLEYNKYKKDMIQDIGAGILMNSIIEQFTGTRNNDRKQKVMMMRL